MKLQRDPITNPLLSRFVDSVWHADDFVQPHARESVLPTGTVDLAIALDGTGANRAAIAGIRSTPVAINTSAPVALIAVHFRPGGAYPFFDLPIDELQDRFVPLSDVWGQAADCLHEQLLEADTSRERYCLIETFLLNRLRDGHGHPAIRHAVAELQQAAHGQSVASIREAIGLSHRRFIDLFQREVGTTPKFFHRLCRFRRVMARLNAAADVGWAALAQSCGYFDQSHFNHDFQQLAGITPTSYLQHRVTASHVRVPD